MKKYLIPLLLGLASFCFATACKEYDELEGSRIITVSASFQDDATRADIEQAQGSLNLVTRWREDDKISLFLLQDGKGYTLEPVKVYNISSDGKRCSFDIRLPADISMDRAYDIYGLCDAEGVLWEEEGFVYAKSALKRMSWNNRIVPMWFHEQGGKSNIQANFLHLGTYEILHVTNTSKAGVTFRHDGFDVEEPWYKSSENTPLKEDYDPTHNVEEPGDDASSGSVFIPAGSTEKFLSWYVPRGGTIIDATLLATINGSSVRSSNTKNSSVRIQRGHVYHMYATWDGNELKFGNANELPDELGIGFTHLDMQEDGAYGFTTGREGHLSFESTDPSVATAIETDDIGEMHVDICAHTIGTAIITITDTDTGQKSQIEVVVRERTDFGATVRLGETYSVKMKNTDGHYEAYSEDESIATSKLVGNTVFITGNKLGNTTIHVTELGTGKQFNIYVLVLMVGPRDSVPEAVDLGLPSGTKWAPYNIGAIEPQGTGLPFSWGEIYHKTNYDWSTYVFADDENGTCYDIGNDISTTQYDVARQRWGRNWSMPTMEQVKELFMNCTIVWKSLEGVNGVEITSRKNGNSIFLPASGYCSENDLLGADRYCYYWTSIQDDENNRLANYFISLYSLETENAIWGTGREERCLGLPVRPVYVDSEVKVPVPEIVDLGLPSGRKWASFNLGATKPEEYGGYYAWGEIEEKEYYDIDTYIWMDYNEKLKKYNDNPDKGVDDDKYSLDAEDDVARMLLGNPWRIPARYEIEELITVCSQAEDVVGGVEGRRFIGSNGKSIFIPYSGCMIKDELYEGFAEIWSSNRYDASSWEAWGLQLDEGGYAGIDGFLRFRGVPVRPVDSRVINVETPPGDPIDLGLPSGTLWASCNVGAVSPESYGHYYAWGEVTEKEEYLWENYQFRYGDGYEVGRYLGENIAGTQFDAAHVNWGGKWRMPSKEEVDELYEHCSREWTSQKGVPGLRLTGPNGRSVFFPASGLYSTQPILWLTDFGYWTSTQSESADVYVYDSGGCSLNGWNASGHPIRPVYDNSVTEIKIPDPVDLGLSVKWGSFNLGATKPSEFGYYYAWGEVGPKDEYTCENYWWYRNKTYSNNQSLTKYCCNSEDGYRGFVDNKKTLELEDDAAHFIFKDKWRIPTVEERNELYEKCKWTWTSKDGIDGYRITGPNGNSIFLPMAGYWSDTRFVRSVGNYWTSSLQPLYSNDTAFCIGFHDESNSIWDQAHRYYGLTIRPVYDDTSGFPSNPPPEGGLD